MKNKALILLLTFAVLGCSPETSYRTDPSDLTYSHDFNEFYTAGDTIRLHFEGPESGKIRLVVQNAWGTSLLSSCNPPNPEFLLPDFYSQKSGNLNWTLIKEQATLEKGSIQIHPELPDASTLESYIGPASIFADGSDQSMLAVMPQDQFGNPLADSTAVSFKQYFEGVKQRDTIFTKNMIAYKAFTSGSAVGKYFVSARVGNQQSKELTLNLLPFLPEDFTINVKRNHPYADGNQIIALATSEIYDRNGNIVADGTQVVFSVQTGSGYPLKTIGHTLSGVAKAGMLHPLRPGTWRIRAYIPAAATSNEIQLKFEPAILDFKVVYDPLEAKILVGPMQSFMGQLIPDGVMTTLAIRNLSGELVHTQQIGSFQGLSSFTLPTRLRLKSGVMEVTVAGISKTIDYP
ncbi:hypothetical protein [Robiginitalea sp. IMCC43444]|uniref:hypothetical protein n=1 Tax=Robiginitalea sp. IMCC43444 TaxID=3459121 RepID=UPI004040EDDA